MFLTEVLNATLVMFVICRVTMDKTIPSYMSGICVGLVYFAVTMSTTRIIGSATNPALSLPFAILKADYDNLLTYLTAPFVGSLLGVFFFSIMMSGMNGNPSKSSNVEDSEAHVSSRKENTSINGTITEKNLSSRLVEEDENDEMIREE